MPDPPLAASEPLLQPLELEKVPAPTPAPTLPDPNTPSTSSSCAVDVDPELVIVQRVEKPLTNGNFKQPIYCCSTFKCSFQNEQKYIREYP